MKNNTTDSLIEKYLSGWYQNNKVPFLSTIIFGLSAYMFVFTNKLINYDELFYTFGKGAGLESGRWGLDILSFLIPNYSMPWLCGLLTILIIAFGVCEIASAFEIKSKVLCALLGGTIVTFTANSSTMLFLYTSHCYALAFLLGTICVTMIKRGKHIDYIGAVVCCVFMLSIYQAYISVLSSLLVLLIIFQLFDREKYDTRTIVYNMVKYIVFLAISLIIYLAVTKVVVMAAGSSFNDYSQYSMNAKTSIINRVIDAYIVFIKVFLNHFDMLIPNDISQLAHAVCAVLACVFALGIVYRQNNKTRLMLLILALIVFPISVNGLFVIIETNVKHAMMMFGVISVYVFSIIVADAYDFHFRIIHYKDILAVSFSIAIIANIFLANISYLKQYMDLQNLEFLFSNAMAQVSSTEGFDSNSKVAFVGWYNMPEYVDNFNGNIIHGAQELGNAYSRDKYVKYYMGLDVELADDNEIHNIEADSRYIEMPRYPYNGYVKKIDNIIVVKF